MCLYGRKLVNYISFDSQLNAEFNAVKLKVDIAEKHSPLFVVSVIFDEHIAI